MAMTMSKSRFSVATEQDMSNCGAGTLAGRFLEVA